MKKINEDFIKEIKEVIQSSKINFMIGAGASQPYLPLLNNIENQLVNATSGKNRIKVCKKYFSSVMYPNIDIVNSGKYLSTKKKLDLENTISSYKAFFKNISTILLKRKSTLLSKQANIFTTNVDIFSEFVLEDLNIEMNDGFCGLINPKFDPSNFKKSYFKRSLHFELLSEIPTINIIKLHGSLTWLKNDISDKIEYSKLAMLDEIRKTTSDVKFENEYNKLFIINPEKKKLENTVLDTIYYDLLRVFSEEMEKENTVLFIIGFSLNDEHLRDLINRSINSNPTLKVYIFCFDSDTVNDINLKIKSQSQKYENIEIIKPFDNKEKNRLDLKKITDSLFSKI
ncbi:MAG TPA: SIR2 family protein [Ignavibacteria bacterium]|nr:hypothetical protein [Bacteroidota bacterium]HRI86116.1 SIR2 family protein [Ignavibacteria bacterium]HRJ99120.1 SIR2 family protein [Ignavibacteria bacterium]